MPTEVDHASVILFPRHSGNTSFSGNLVPELPKIMVSEYLDEIERPLDNLPDNATIINFKSKDIPGTFTLRHCDEFDNPTTYPSRAH